MFRSPVKYLSHRGGPGSGVYLWVIFPLAVGRVARRREVFILLRTDMLIKAPTGAPERRDIAIGRIKTYIRASAIAFDV